MKQEIPPESTEVELVRRATQGDLAAFEELVAKYQRAVFNIALYKCKNYFDAEDLSQDIFLAAFKALSSLKDPEKFPGWLFGIAYNRCHKWYHRERNKILKIQEIKQRVAREERQRYRRPRDDALGGGGSSTTGQLSEVLERLPGEIREVLKLKYLDGLSYQEIEEKLDINSNRIDYLIRKGKQLLRQKISQQNEA